MDCKREVLLEEHDIGLVDAVEVEKGFVLEYGHDKGVFLGGLARWVRTLAHGNGDGVARLMNGCVFGRQFRHEFAQGDGILLGRKWGQIGSNGPVHVQFGKSALWVNVIMDVHLTVHVPEDEKVLLEAMDWWRALDFGALTE